MEINYQEIEDIANSYYAEVKARKHNLDLRYMAPEQLPKIQSDQVKCFMRALIEELNWQFQHNQ